MFFTAEETKHEIIGNVDQYADSYARDVDMQELLRVSLGRYKCPLKID